MKPRTWIQLITLISVGVGASQGRAFSGCLDLFAGGEIRLGQESIQVEQAMNGVLYQDVVVQESSYSLLAERLTPTPELIDALESYFLRSHASGDPVAFARALARRSDGSTFLELATRVIAKLQARPGELDPASEGVFQAFLNPLSIHQPHEFLNLAQSAFNPVSGSFSAHLAKLYLRDLSTWALTSPVAWDLVEIARQAPDLKSATVFHMKNAHGASSTYERPVVASFDPATTGVTYEILSSALESLGPMRFFLKRSGESFEISGQPVDLAQARETLETLLRGEDPCALVAVNERAAKAGKSRKKLQMIDELQALLPLEKDSNMRVPLEIQQILYQLDFEDAFDIAQNWVNAHRSLKPAHNSEDALWLESRVRALYPFLEMNATKHLRAFLLIKRLAAGVAAGAGTDLGQSLIGRIENIPTKP